MMNLRKGIVIAGLMLVSVFVNCTKEVEVEKIVYREDTSITGDLRNQISSLQNQILNLQGQVSNLQVENAALYSEISDNEDTILSLESTISDLESSSGTNSDTIASLESQISELESENAELQDEIDSLENDISELNSDIDDLKDEIADLEAEANNTPSDDDSDDTPSLSGIYSYSYNATRTTTEKLANSNVENVFDVIINGSVTDHYVIVFNDKYKMESDTGYGSYENSELSKVEKFLNAAIATTTDVGGTWKIWDKNGNYNDSDGNPITNPVGDNILFNLANASGHNSDLSVGQYLIIKSGTKFDGIFIVYKKYAKGASGNYIIECERVKLTGTHISYMIDNEQTVGVYKIN